jgi:hypothetical protein
MPTPVSYDDPSARQRTSYSRTASSNPLGHNDVGSIEVEFLDDGIEIEHQHFRGEHACAA